MLYCKDTPEGLIFNDGKTLQVGDTWIFNPTHEHFIKNGWREYVNTLDDNKEEKLAAMQKHYQTLKTLIMIDHDIKHITFNDIIDIKELINSAIDVGRKTIYILPLNLHIETTKAKKMMSEYRIYQMDCDDHALELKEQIQAAKTQEALDAIDITAGYPNLKNFSA